MPNLNRRERILVGLAAIVLIGLGFWYFSDPSTPAAVTAGRPDSGSKTSTGTAGKSAGAALPLEQALARNSDGVKTLKRMTREEAEMMPQLAKATSTLPPDDMIPRMIQDLQNIATRSGVHLREIKPIQPKPLRFGEGMRVPIEVRFRAAFQPGIVRFLYYVEDPSTRMVVEKMTINAGDRRFKSVDVSLQIATFTRAALGGAGADGGDSSNGKEKSGISGREAPVRVNSQEQPQSEGA